MMAIVKVLSATIEIEEGHYNVLTESVMALDAATELCCRRGLS